MKRLVLITTVVVAILAAGGLITAASGVVPTKASSGHWAITSWFLHFAMRRSAATHSLGVEVPALDGEALVLKGAAYYELSCRSCHGAPGSAPPPITQGMLPRPRELSPLIPERSPRQLFHIVKHGIKFTGMPAFPSQERDDEVWAVVAFLLRLPSLDAAGYQQLARPVAAAHPVPPPLSKSPVLSAALAQCVQCHGESGHSRSSLVPTLARQRSGYVEDALRAYAGGRRHSGMMQPFAKPLDEAAITRLVAHYAGLPSPPVSAKSLGSPESSGWRQADQIARQGIPARRVPACFECHDPGGHRASERFPTLRGQPADYLRKQLELFHENRRGGGPSAHLMQPIAARLTAEEIEVLSQYFSALTPESPAPRP